MTLMLQLAVVVLIVVLMLVAMIPQWRESKRRLGSIWMRACTGREWKRQFPDTPSTDIRRFLTLLTDSFGFDEAKRLKFRPTDTVMEIYRAVYPQQGWPDGLEMESFMLRVEDAYRCTVTEEWNFTELTLGELFGRTRSPNIGAQGRLASSPP